MGIIDDFSIFITTSKTLAKQYLRCKELADNQNTAISDSMIFKLIIEYRYKVGSPKNMPLNDLEIAASQLADSGDNRYKFDEFVLLILSAENDIFELDHQSIAKGRKQIGNTLNDFDNLPRDKFDDLEFDGELINSDIFNIIEQKKTLSIEGRILFMAIVLKMKSNGNSIIVFVYVDNTEFPMHGNIEFFELKDNNERYMKQQSFDDLVNSLFSLLGNQEIYEVLDVQYFTDKKFCFNCKSLISINDNVCSSCNYNSQI